jgi:hypothetical protein
MTLTTAIVLIVLADVALIAGLAWAMSRPAKLTPHVPAPGDEQPPARMPRIWRPLPGDGTPRSGTRDGRSLVRETAGNAS